MIVPMLLSFYLSGHFHKVTKNEKLALNAATAHTLLITTFAYFYLFVLDFHLYLYSLPPFAWKYGFYGDFPVFVNVLLIPFRVAFYNFIGGNVIELWFLTLKIYAIVISSPIFNPMYRISLRLTQMLVGYSVTIIGIFLGVLMYHLKINR